MIHDPKFESLRNRAKRGPDILEDPDEERLLEVKVSTGGKSQQDQPTSEPLNQAMSRASLKEHQQFS